MYRPLLFFILLASLSGTLSAQELSFFESFADHAVLQRGVDHPVWGWAKPNRKVTVTLGDETRRAVADRSGRWEVTFGPMAAGGPHTLTALAGRERIAATDVYFGDVYLLSGQSNMEWQLRQSDPSGQRAADISDPLIRELKVQKSYANSPDVHLPVDPQYGENWMVGDETMENFSAVGSYFAHYLREEVDVPIGLIHASWGGSRLEPWLSAEAMGGDATSVLAEREDRLAAASKPARDNFMRNFPGRELPTEDKGEAQGWLRPDFDDSAWPKLRLPNYWENVGYPSVDGVFYFRGTFELTAEQAAAGATLHLGAIDDGDWTHVNGELVGSNPNAYSKLRVYPVDASILRSGTNQIAFRIYDGMGGGGFSAGDDGFYLETATGRVSLVDDYKYNIGEFRVDAQPNQVPTILYNAMIAPLKGMPLSGVLWYQGESNAGNGDNVAYADLMKTLVISWREFFDNDELPFYWVQLANFMDPVKTPNEPGWAVLRQSQTAALELPLTGQAVITDIGEADDIHPKNKWEVGRRLSLYALKDIYNKDVIAASPAVDKVASLDGLVMVKFKNAPNGMMVKSDDRYQVVRGFTVMDEEGAWHFAPAVLFSGESGVVISNPSELMIRKVRYNWASNPDGNLFSREGLPVDGFEVEVE